MFKQSLLNNDCLIFTGTLSEKGYGQIHYQRRTHKCHRLSAMFFLELDITDESLQVNHKPECTSRACWDPEHLYIGTAKQNTGDIVRPLLVTHCKYGHELTEDNITLGNRGARNCKICARERAAAYYERNK